MLRARVGLSPVSGQVGAIDDVGYLLDTAHDLLLGLDVANGNFLPMGPKLTTIDVGGQAAVWQLAFGSETTLLGFTRARPFRVELGTTPVTYLGTLYSASDDRQDPTGTLRTASALQPGKLRLAYVRGDGDIGFLSWPDTAGPSTPIRWRLRQGISAPLILDAVASTRGTAVGWTQPY